MSATREAIQAEILSLIAGTDNCGVAEICPSQSLRDLLERDAQGSLPAIGIAYRGRVPDGEAPFGAKGAPYMTRWEVSIVHKNSLSRASALAEVMPILDRVGTRLVRERATVSNKARYEVVNEDVEDVDDDGVAALLAIQLPAWMDT